MGGDVDVCFQTRVDPSREAVIANEGSGRRTARTWKESVRIHRTPESTYITSMAFQNGTELEGLRSHHMPRSLARTFEIAKSGSEKLALLPGLEKHSRLLKWRAGRVAMHFQDVLHHL